MARALDPDYFDALYAGDSDPWRFETSAYEAAKYRETLKVLPLARYGSAIEIGCSIGVLSERLAGRCERLLGVDVAQAALDQAMARCAALPQVSFALKRLPGEVPEGRFDLVMLSEVLYYFDAERLAGMAAAVRAMALPGADIVLVHWLGETPDYPMSGDEAVAGFVAAAQPWAEITQQQRTEKYRLDLLRVAPAA